MDKKYRAGNVAVNKEQMATIDEAMELFLKETGLRLTRSQMFTWLAYSYILKNKKGN